MRTVLITGASGFIGRALRAGLSPEFSVLTLTSSDADIDSKQLFALFENQKIDHVFHLAALNFVPDSWNAPHEYVRVNALGTVNVLDLCRLHNARLTFVSSYLYGAPQKLPIAEDAPIQVVNPYALSKTAAEQFICFYNSNFGIPTCIIRPFNIYGPGQKDDFLLPTLVRQAMTSGTIEINDIRPKRDFTYIDDFIGALISTTRIESNLEIINIGYGKSYSIPEIVSLLGKILGKEIRITDKKIWRPNEILDVVADIEKAKNILGWTPTTSLQAGLTKMIQSWVKNQ